MLCEDVIAGEQMCSETSELHVAVHMSSSLHYSFDSELYSTLIKVVKLYLALYLVVSCELLIAAFRQ